MGEESIFPMREPIAGGKRILARSHTRAAAVTKLLRSGFAGVLQHSTGPQAPSAYPRECWWDSPLTVRTVGTVRKDC
eukprot:6919050-Pyramimonas_sp.AAC.1